MNLKKISIENFKCFGKQVDIDFGRITLLTGANSSGKSSIIYAILGAIQSGEFPFQFSPNGNYVNMGDFKEIVHNHKTESQIRLNFTLTDTPIQEIKTTWGIDKKNNLPKLIELKTTLINETFTIKLENAHYLSNFTSEGNSKWVEISIAPEIGASPYSNSKSMVNGLVLLFTKYDNCINFISPFRRSSERTYFEQSKANLKIGNTGEGYLDQIIYWETNKDPKLKQLVERIKKLKLLHSFKAKRVGGGKYEILVKVKKGGIETSLSDVGSGVSQFLPIMVADLQLPDNSTLYIAEPEAHLHPSIQSSIGDYLSNQINTTSKNYVIETHSEYFLNKIRLAIVKGEIKEEDVSVIFLDNEGDENVIHKIGFKKNGQITNAPKNFFKTYMMDVMEIAINAAE